MSIKAVLQLARHPFVNIMAGIFMMGSAVAEIFSDAFASMFGVQVGLEHGILAAGVVHTLKAVPELFEGATKIEEAESKGKHEAPGKPNEA